LLSVLSHRFILLKYLRSYKGPCSALVSLPRHIVPLSWHTAKSTSRHTATHYRPSHSSSRHTVIHHLFSHLSPRHTVGKHNASPISWHTALAAQPHSQPPAPRLPSPKGTLEEEKIDKSDQPRMFMPSSELRKISQTQVQRNLPHPSMNAVDLSSLNPLTWVPLPRPNTTPLFSVFTPCSSDLLPSSTLRPTHWQHLLQHYLDPSFVQNLVGIAIYGARIEYMGLPHTIHAENYASAL